MGVVCATIVILSVWVPVWHHYRAPVAPITDAVIERSRSSPDDTLLTEIGRIKHHLTPPMGRLVSDPVSQADQILAASAAAWDNGEPVGSFFEPEKLGVVDYASFLVPKTLLEAFVKSGEQRYFDAAKRFIMEFAEYESKAWLPHKFLWHDHSIAVRSSTFSEFWRLYRNSPQFDVAEARKFLKLVAVSAKQLANPDMYTFVSNHGTQQNLGLMHLCLAFGELPGFDDYANLVVARHNEHVNLLINDEGVVLEHSTGYHRFGVELLAIAMRYVTLMGRTVPANWIEKYTKARDFFWQFRGPDGSIPRVGDSSDAARRIGPLMTDVTEDGRATTLRRDNERLAPTRPYTLHPDAGYAIIWSGQDGPAAGLSRTVMSWSYFPGFPHKHADELSINIWQPTGRWWTNVGYFPYSSEHRAQALGWSGSNAPHLVGESADSERYSWLRGFVATQNATLVDVQRDGPGSFSVRRQLVHIAPDAWLVFDWFGGARDSPTRTVWGMDPDLVAQEHPASGALRLSSPGRDAEAFAFFVSQPPVRPRIVQGQKEPFAGWVEVDYEPRESTAVIIEQPAGALWALNATVLSDAGDLELHSRAEVTDAGGPETWSVQLPTRNGPLSVARRDGVLSFTRGEQDGRIELDTGFRQHADGQTVSKRAYEAALQKYGPPFADLIAYRWQMTTILVVLFVAQELCVIVCGIFARRYVTALRVAAALAWLLVGVWLHLSFFSVPNAL